jgi:two-component system, NarL family, response regulator NreC
MPYRDMLTPLMQRLVRLVGAPAALQLARTIPKLAVDTDGAVLDYDRDDPRTTARLLIEHYEVAVAIAGSLTQPAPHDLGGDANHHRPLESGTLSAPPIRILVVDDHALVREGLVSLLDPQPDLQVVGQAGSVREAVALAQCLRPDMVLMDFTLPDGTGEEATRAILATLPATKIVFLTVHDDDARLFAALAAGAIGYLLKSVRSADLLSRLRGAVRGEVALSPAIAQRILVEVARRPPRRAAAVAAREELAAREVEIVRLIVQGYTNRQIADALMLSVRTIENRRANLMRRLGLRSRADLVRYAAAHDLLDTKDASHKPGPERCDTH